MRNLICGLGALALTASVLGAGCGGDDDPEADEGSTAATGGILGTGATSGGGTGGGTGGGVSGGTGGSDTGGSAGADTGSGGTGGANSAQCPDQAPWGGGTDCSDDGLVCAYTGGFGDVECTCADGNWDCVPVDGGAGGAPGDSCPASEPTEGDACALPGRTECPYGDVTCSCNRNDEWTCSGGGGPAGGAGGQPGAAGGAAGAAASMCPTTEPTDGDSCDYQGPPCDYGNTTCGCWGSNWNCN